LVLFGPPGAGKGTQAQLLVDRLNIPHISSGDLFRHHLQNGTPLGLKAADYMNRGALVPDELTIDITLEKVMSLNTEEGFILDGFPRNQFQARALEAALQTKARGLDKVVYIDVPEDELLRRLEGRYICRQCQAPHSIPADRPADKELTCERCGGELYQRTDDRSEAVQKRIEVYRTETVPVLDFYRERDILAEIPGVDTTEQINRKVLEALGL
jgi:adenylate kinase